MTITHFFAGQILVSFLAVLFVVWYRRLTFLEGLVVIACGLILSLAFGAKMESGEKNFSFFGLQGMAQFFPLLFVMCTGLALALFFNKKALPQIHEGEALLASLTMLYATTTFSPGTQKFVMFFALPFALVLLYEIISPRPLSRGNRFWLSLLFSLSICVTCFHQISYFDDLVRLRDAGETSDWLMHLETFGLQLTTLWSCFHIGRFIVLLPSKNERNYLRRLRSETVPEYANQVASHSVPWQLIAAAGVLHGMPLILNMYTELLSPQLMISYSVIISPVIVELALRRLGKVKA